MDFKLGKRGSYHFLVWHPSVHKHFNEDLYYFLISPAIFDQWFKVTVEKNLRGCDVKGWSMYEVYGFYDVLVRAWMTSSQRHQFISNLEDDLPILDMAYFFADEIDYLWSDYYQKKPKLETSYINEIAPNELQSVQTRDPDPNRLNELRDKGYLLKYKKINTDKAFDGIKFYVMLNYPVPAPQNELKEDIKKYISENHAGVRDATIYTGSGFSKFLLKGIVDNDGLFKIQKFTQRLVTRFKIIRMKSTTLLISTPKVFESDHINFTQKMDRVHQSVDLSKLSISQDSLKNLGKYELRLVQEKYEDLDDAGLLKIHKDTFAPLFEAFINKDAKKIKRNLFPILEFESDLRQFGTRLMATLYGKKWEKLHLSQLLRSVGLREDINIERLSMSDWISILGSVDSETSEIEKILGPEWESILRTAASLRNEFAHNRLGDPIDIWGNIIEFFSELLPRHLAIKQWIIESKGLK